MKKIAILFGGVSAEHEVSVITGLQVLEEIDKKLFQPLVIRLGQDGLFYYYPRVLNRKDYSKTKPLVVNFARESQSAYFQNQDNLNRKIYIDGAYLAFHGGNGESGQVQGLLEVLNIPYTSTSLEASAIAMNKVLTKEVLQSNGIKTAPWLRVFSDEVKEDTDKVVTNLLEKLKLPLIIKPVHLGSSIAINIAKTQVELKKHLLEASQIDSEILVEKFMTNIKEYNVAVRRVSGQIEASEVEKPISKDAILSFADKYQSGGQKSAGMAFLDRELPANISDKLADALQGLAIDVFKLIRAKGMLRVDFMVAREEIFVIEVNPIPGSMAFYLWEASGYSFREQITHLIEQAFKDNDERNSRKLNYETDIVEKFIKNTSR